MQKHPVKLQVAPSLLAADAARLADDCARAEAAGADLFHLDVMDGHFVPNLTFGPHVARAVKKSTRLPVTAHLMIEYPERIVEAFIDSGADAITVHAEAPGDPLSAFEKILAAGRRAGVALNPDTPVSRAERFLSRAGIVLLMTVFPGFGGQDYIPGSAGRFAEIRGRVPAGAWLEVDGGINAQTAAHAVAAGANCLAAGTYLFKAPDMAAAIRSLRAAGGN